MLEFVALIYVYEKVVSKNILEARTNELEELFKKRMLRNKLYFKNNDLITSSYSFIYTVLDAYLFKSKYKNEK